MISCLDHLHVLCRITCDSLWYNSIASLIYIAVYLSFSPMPFLFLTWPLTPWVLLALRMPCEWKEMHYCLFTRWKKNETLLLMFLNMLQMWEFGFLFLNVDELVIYSTVFLFHMKLFFSNNSFYWLFHFSTWRKILLKINKIIIKNQSFVRYLFYCIFC